MLNICKKWLTITTCVPRDARRMLTANITFVSTIVITWLLISYTRALQPVATCRQWSYIHKPAIIIMTSFSLWRHSRVSRLRRSQPPFSLWRNSHYDVIRYWAGHAQRYGRTLRTDTLRRLIYKYTNAHEGRYPTGSWSCGVLRHIAAKTIQRAACTAPDPVWTQLWF